MSKNKKELLIILFWILVAANIFWFGYRIINRVVNGAEVIESAGIIDNTELNRSNFYYEQLSEEYKKAYELLHAGLLERSNSIKIEGLESDSIASIWKAVLLDNPGIFWVNDFRYSVIRDDVTVCEIIPNYCYTTEEIELRQKKIEEFVSEFVSGISKTESDYDKILYAYETIINHTEYDLNALNNQHIDSVIVGKKSVCGGYAKTMKFLLNRLGVECIYISGIAENDEGVGNHAWNIVKCEDAYYYVDSTWGDPIYLESLEEFDSEEKAISYDYLCCNEEQLFVTHQLNEDYEYPSCTSLEWNYYVVNGRYFTEYNASRISELIRKDIEENKKLSTFKFADKSTYEIAKEQLLDVHLKEGKSLYDVANDTEGTSSYYVDDSKRNKVVLYWDTP